MTTTNKQPIKIDKNIPLPNQRGTLTAAFRSMNPGDSILIPAAEKSTGYQLASREGISVRTKTDGDMVRYGVARKNGSK
jgi:hypothetical protein